MTFALKYATVAIAEYRRHRPRERVAAFRGLGMRPSEIRQHEADKSWVRMYAALRMPPRGSTNERLVEAFFGEALPIPSYGAHGEYGTFGIRTLRRLQRHRRYWNIRRNDRRRPA